MSIGRVSITRPDNSILSPHYNTLSKLNCILASIEANKLNYDEGIMNEEFHINDFVEHMREKISIEGGWDKLSWGTHKDKVVSKLMSRES